MPETRRERIIKAAIDILSKEPNGLRTAELTKRRLREALNDDHKKGIHTVLMKYVKTPDALIYQPSRGWFRHKKFQDGAAPAASNGPAPPHDSIPEERFYQPFADWLVEDLDECTKAIVVGGNKMKDRFGTPDVVGVFTPSRADLIQFPIEIVSVEIKVAPEGLITAFGQACSYRLFSHKCYIVIPDTAAQEDVAKLESLCLIFGIGLILLDPTSPQKPNFRIRTRAIRHDPDMFYMNVKIQPIAKELLE